ncbi:putative signal transducing protein [Flavobacterium sangjuense]|uniref:DUF2007 domain-containing protein n=1 Tax=Flavobacterium sangjuense TaxID=2518177 RepID=A0A4P7PTY4_9FLAO|nr:DUF2007 domain-containing protein [Flavobacterium sangjuense]QBZ97313.1 hypothetical protein GS03_00799 [Flavobacterium sangjuense]
MEEEKFKMLRRFQYSSEAIIYQGKLESQGIEVFMRDQNLIDSTMYSNLFGGIKMFVKTEDFERANDILNDVNLFSVDDDEQL